jgi:hypothetical protein
VAQDYESIGQLSPEAEHIAAEKAGWQGEIPEDLGQQQTMHDFSGRLARANTQAKGLVIPNMAGYADEPPAAALQVEPW